MMRARVERNVWRLPHSPFASGPPWVASQAAAARALTWLVAKTTTTHLDHVRPLSENFSEWQRVCLMDRWMSRLISRGYTLQFTSRPPTVQWDTGNTPVIPRTVSCAPGRAAGTPVERGYFQGSARGRKSGVLLPLFSCPEKDRGG